MHKLIISVLFVSVVGLIVMTITTNMNRPGEMVVYTNDIDQSLLDNDLDPNSYSVTLKNRLSDCKITYTEDLHEGNYVTPSASKYQFERHWGVDSKIDYDKKSTLEVTSTYLEFDNCEKVILVSITVPYHVTTVSSKDFIHVSHSLNYNLNITGDVSYVQDNATYVLDEFTTSESINGDDAYPYDISLPGVSLQENNLYTDNQINIPYNTQSLGYFNYPALTYSYYIELVSTEDNIKDDYVGIDIDFYRVKEDYDSSITLGFNKFKQSSEYDIYVVKRMSLSYKREES